MAKLTLDDIASGYGSSTKHNSNNDKIETALENTLSRDGTGPNEMEANLDMNSYRILNLPNAVNNAEPVTLGQANTLAGVENPLTQNSVSAVLWPQTAAETAAGVTPTYYHYEPLNALRYGADPTGVSDSGAAFNDMSAVLESIPGGVATIPPGTYLCSTEWDIDFSHTENTGIWAYGAEITTSGAISGVKMRVTATPHLFTIYGLKINHRGNANAVAGFELYGSANVRLKDCTVEAHGVDSAYAAFLLHNTDAADSNTGNFWTVLEDCTVRKRSGADSGNIPYGVYLRGSQNATTIRGGNIGGTVTTAIYIAPEAGQTAISNGVLIDGTAFEGGTTAVHAAGATASPIGGLRVVNCRCESYTTFLSLTGSTSQPVVSPYFSGNYITPDITTYLNNPNNLVYRSFDDASNPLFRAVFYGQRALQVRSIEADSHGLIVTPAAETKGLVVTDTGGTIKLRLEGQGTGTLCRVTGVSAGEMAVTCVQGISGSGTDAENLRGQVTLSSGTASVSFGTAEPDASYYIALSGSANETFYWASKGTGGFTINSSNGSSTATVDWIIIR